MIGYLKGYLLDVSDETAILSVAGVGYEVHADLRTLEALQSVGHKEIELWIHTHVREDALTLFGFLSKPERHFFLSLLKVNGIGPKSALNILSGATADQVSEMIETGDAKRLSQLPKVGKKTAEQMILTLKGKLVFASEERAPAGASKNPARVEISSALINLGFRPQDVERVVEDLPPGLEMEEGVRRGLQALSNI